MDDKLKPTHLIKSKESPLDKQIRYEAQLIVAKRGVDLSQAIEIARVEHERRAEHNQKRELAVKKQNALKERRREKAKTRSTLPLYKTHGLPMQGGAPGLGKKK